MEVLRSQRERLLICTPRTVRRLCAVEISSFGATPIYSVVFGSRRGQSQDLVSKNGLECSHARRVGLRGAVEVIESNDQNGFRKNSWRKQVDGLVMDW